MKTTKKIMLPENEMPTQWYNIVADMKNKPLPMLNPATKQPLKPEEMEALFAKGVGLGTILSFMMGVTALSLPSIIMLKKAVKAKLLVVFCAIVTVGIIFIGYIFNALQGLFM